MTAAIAVAIQKGGVGKSTLALHLACLAHETDQRVLLVDLDQQGSSTLACSGDSKRHLEKAGTVLDLWDDGVDKLPAERSLFGFDYLPASQYLDAVDDDIKAGMAALQKIDEYGYDLVIFDCPPAPGVRQIAPLLLSDVQAAPVTPDKFGTQGMLNALRQYQGQIRSANPDLTVRFVINLHKLTSGTQKLTIQQIQEKMGPMICPTVLTDREAVKHALAQHKPVWAHSSEPFAQDWRTACEYLLSFAEDESRIGEEVTADEAMEEDLAQ
ncbi:ParA family protein [Acidithiobacillus caldus]|uniref:ParA family protein n=1 Tax=Acidithiobacillus caldus TaxID=33059 RepID=UPI0007DA42A1|nr:ParA family protein [Acidithiobacillus caldus]QER44976.1 ATPase involved in chromosome partitioning [Acidithiobacillus caldus]